MIIQKGAVFIIVAILIMITLGSMTSNKKNLDVISEKGERLTLTRGQPAHLKAGDVVVTLEETKVPGEQCADCITSATLIVTRGSESQTMEFQTGGIRGNIPMEKQVFGYGLLPAKIDTNSIVLLYYKR